MSGTPIEKPPGPSSGRSSSFLNPGMLGHQRRLQATQPRAGATARGRGPRTLGQGRCGRSSSVGPRRRSSRTFPRSRKQTPATATWSRRSASSTRSSGRTNRSALLRKGRRRAETGRRSRSSKRFCGSARPPATPALIDPTPAPPSPAPSSTCSCPRSAKSSEEGHKVLRLLAVHQLPWRSCVTGSTRKGLRYEYPRRPHPQTRAEAGRAVPERPPKIQIFLISLKAGGPRPEPDRRRIRLPARPVVETPPSKPRPSTASHRIGQTQPRLRLPPDLRRHNTVEEKILELQSSARRDHRPDCHLETPTTA